VLWFCLQVAGDANDPGAHIAQTLDFNEPVSCPWVLMGR